MAVGSRRRGSGLRHGRTVPWGGGLVEGCGAHTGVEGSWPLRIRRRGGWGGTGKAAAVSDLAKGRVGRCGRGRDLVGSSEGEGGMAREGPGWREAGWGAMVGGGVAPSAEEGGRRGRWLGYRQRVGEGRRLEVGFGHGEREIGRAHV